MGGARWTLAGRPQACLQGDRPATSGRDSSEGAYRPKGAGLPERERCPVGAGHDAAGSGMTGKSVSLRI